MRRFYDCGLSEKVLYTSFLIIIGSGYLMAMMYLYASHSGHDDKPGVSINDIAETYYGNRSGSRLEAAIRGPMSPYIKIEDRNHVVEWLKSGAPEADYDTRIAPILKTNCVVCHSPASGLKVPDLSSYSGIREVTQIDTGKSIQTLMKLSHIHLFGVGLILLGTGMIFRFTELRLWLKITIIIVPFASILVDIIAWFLTKWDPYYAYTVVAAGAFLGLSIAAQSLISLYQIWFLKRPQSTKETRMNK